jgi:hypothetical protein
MPDFSSDKGVFQGRSVLGELMLDERIVLKSQIPDR